MKKKICPLLRKECQQEGCEFWVYITGKNPQTNEDETQFACAFAWFPMLLLENCKQQQQTRIAIGELKEETIKSLNSPVLKALASKIVEYASIKKQETNIIEVKK